MRLAPTGASLPGAARVLVSVIGYMRVVYPAQAAKVKSAVPFLPDAWQRSGPANRRRAAQDVAPGTWTGTSSSCGNASPGRHAARPMDRLFGCAQDCAATGTRSLARHLSGPRAPGTRVAPRQCVLTRPCPPCGSSRSTGTPYTPRRDVRRPAAPSARTRCVERVRTRAGRRGREPP